MFPCGIVRFFIASNKPVLHAFCGLAQSTLRSTLREKPLARRVLRNLWQSNGYERQKFLYEQVPGLEGRQVPWLDLRGALRGVAVIVDSPSRQAEGLLDLDDVDCCNLPSLPCQQSFFTLLQLSLLQNFGWHHTKFYLICGIMKTWPTL